MRSRHLFVLVVPVLWAQSDSQKAIEVLRANCASCHGTAMQMSSLRVDSREALIKGGAKGPAITAGNSAQSRLLQLVTHAAQPSMPPGRKLSDADINVLRTWIDAGAPWPKEGGALEIKAAAWWSFKPPVRSEPPNRAGSAPIDRFLHAKIAQNDIKTAQKASKSALVRRAFYDLHGLPPTFEQSQKFINDTSPDAWEKLIDELLASPRYGEKWGRHWLDLVR